MTSYSKLWRSAKIGQLATEGRPKYRCISLVFVLLLCLVLWPWNFHFMMKLLQLQVLFTSRHAPVMMEHKTCLAQEHKLQLQMSVPRAQQWTQTYWNGVYVLSSTDENGFVLDRVGRVVHDWVHFAKTVYKPSLKRRYMCVCICHFPLFAVC